MKRSLCGMALAWMLSTSALAGQQTREALVDQALASSDDAARIDFLLRALDPALGAPDSAWAVGAFSMAFRLTELDREAEASDWLRWAAREGAGLGLSPADFPALFPPPLVDAYGRARAQVEAQGAPGDAVVASEWTWPASYSSGADGALTVRVEGAGAGVEIEIEGIGPVDDGQTVAVPPGTYRLLVSGDGVEPVAVRREVLPGVSRTLRVAATAVLFPGAQARAEGSLFRLRRTVSGAQVCSSGVVAAGTDGLVVAPLGMLDADDLELVAPDGRVFGAFEVALRDDALGVGVARLGDVALRALETNESPSGPIWVLFHDGCGPVSTERVTLGAEAANGMYAVTGAPPQASGGALLDQQGQLVALGLPGAALSAAGLADLVERARQRPIVAVATPAARETPEQSGGDGGGGFPVKWVAAGAAAVGVAALLLGGGGGGGGEEPTPRTGIIITWPGG